MDMKTEKETKNGLLKPWKEEDWKELSCYIYLRNITNSIDNNDTNSIQKTCSKDNNTDNNL